MMPTSSFLRTFLSLVFPACLPPGSAVLQSERTGLLSNAPCSPRPMPYLLSGEIPASFNVQTNLLYEFFSWIWCFLWWETYFQCVSVKRLIISCGYCISLLVVWKFFQHRNVLLDIFLNLELAKYLVYSSRHAINTWGMNKRGRY